MSIGLDKTLGTLASTKNEAAVAALIPALDSRHKRIQHGALRTLLERRSPAGQREIVRRLHAIDDTWQSIITEKPGRLSAALRNAVLDDDPQFCLNGCNAAIAFGEYDLIAPLVSAAENESNRNRDLAARTLRDLASLLYDELAAPRDYGRRRDPQLVRRHVLESLEKSVDRYAKHRRVEILEAFLMLTNRDNALVKQILRDPYHNTFLPMIDTLTHSSARGVMRLALSFLDDPHTPHAAINVVAHRNDIEFVRHLLKRIGFEPSKIASQNLKRVDKIAWLEDYEELVDKLDDAAQHSAIQFALASGVRRLTVFSLVEHLIQHGTPGGRRAAVAVLSRFKGATANEHLVRAVEDDDPQVQANAAVQLRERSIPGAMSKLIELIDSPHTIVRDAARRSMSEFSFRRYLAAYDMLDEDIRISTGVLVSKIDVEAVPQLVAEMAERSRTRRLRAIRVAASMGLAERVEPQIIEMLNDRDHIIRQEAARALSHSETSTAVQALRQALLDRSVSVQEVAEESLKHLIEGVQQAKHGDEGKEVSAT
ncbi:MAG: HEAT repeat domain-containing protein [Pirellulales bacterium]|nr:HEAT repeat domain-containing protein [Pirellulales bacterium]